MIIDYSQYNYFGHLCEVPQDVLNNLQECYSELKIVKPDRSLDYYDQWFLQDTRIGSERVEISWSHWRNKEKLLPTLIFFSQYVNHICKFRFSRLDKTSEVAYHTRHSLPRIHIPLNDAESTFVVKDNDKEFEYKLTYGHAHFINVTLQHKVVNSNQNERVNSFFCFTHFASEKLKERFIRNI